MKYIPRGYMLLPAAIEAMVDQDTKTSQSERANLREQERRLELWRGGPNDPQPDPLLRPFGPYRADTRTDFPPEVAARLVAVRKVLLDHSNTWRACAARIHQALGDGDLQAMLLCDDGTLRDVPPAVWRRDVSDLNFKEGFLAWQYGQYPHERIAGDVLLTTNDFHKWTAPAPVRTAAAQARYRNRLTEIMTANPDAPVPKDVVHAEMMEAEMVDAVARDARDRIWTETAKQHAPKWAARGRRPAPKLSSS